MRITRTFAFFILCVSLFALPTFGAELTWTGGANTDWGNASNWTPQQAPVNGDTLTINAVANMPTNLPTGYGVINLTGGMLTLDGEKHFGTAASTMDTVFNQTGGTLKTGGRIWWGVSNPYKTTYNLHSGASLEGTVFQIGQRSESVWNIYEGATATLIDDFYVGLYSNAGRGTLNMYGESLSTRDFSLSLGGGSTGEANLYAGNVTVGRSLYVGRGGTGTLLIDGANLTTAATSYVGTVEGSDKGTGTLTINDGKFTQEANADFVLGHDGANADLTINGGELLFKGPNMLFGDGTGTVTVEINGGKLNHQGSTGLDLGHNGSKTEMTINNDGQLIFNGKQPFRIGNTASGKLILNGGLIDYQSGSHLLVGYASGTGELIINGGLLDIKTTTDLRVGDADSTASVLMTGGEFRHAAGGNFVLIPTTANEGKGSLFVMTGGEFNGAYISINQLGGNDAKTATMELSGGTVNLKNQLRVGQDGWGTLTVSGGSVAASGFLVNIRGTGSVFNLIGSKSEWELGSMTSNASAQINLKLDSGGLSTLKVSGAATVNGTVSDILSVPGAAIVKTNSVDFVSAGSLGATPTFNSSIFTQTANGGTLSYAFNDDNLDTLMFGDDHQSITFATPQESGWIRLEQSGAADNSIFNISVAGDLGAGTVDDLLLYLNDSLDGFGYKFKEADSLTDLHLFDLNINPLNSEGYAYFGWDFEGFNDAYANAAIGLFGAGAIGASASGVPEPATWVMLLLGAAAMGIFCRKRGKSM